MKACNNDTPVLSLAIILEKRVQMFVAFVVVVVVVVAVAIAVEDDDKSLDYTRLHVTYFYENCDYSFTLLSQRNTPTISTSIILFDNNNSK